MHAELYYPGSERFQGPVGIPFSEQPIAQITPQSDTPNSEVVRTRVLLGKQSGRDIYVETFARDGVTVFDRQKDEAQELVEMVGQFSIGERHFRNYEHNITVLSSELIAAERDAIGTTTLYAEFFGLGYHYRNGIGKRVPRERALNPKNIPEIYRDGEEAKVRMVNQDETRGFIKVTKTPWKPDELFVSLVRTDDPSFASLLKKADEARLIGEKSKFVTEIINKVQELEGDQEVKAA
jgi:hypothetical protein